MYAEHYVAKLECTVRRRNVQKFWHRIMYSQWQSNLFVRLRKFSYACTFINLQKYITVSRHSTNILSKILK